MIEWAYFSSAIEAIKGWQTLITGILALIAAYATIRVIHHQIALQKKQFEDIQERKRWAARARIPGALSEISSFTRNVASNILSEIAICPTEPTHAIETLINSMPYQEKNAANKIALLVEHYQVHNARFKSHIAPEQNRHIGQVQKSDMLYDTALLHAYTNSLFEYGRRESEIGPTEDPTCDEIFSGLTNAIGLINIVREDPVYLGAVKIVNRLHSAEPVDE